MNIWTRNLTTPITLTKADGVFRLSFKALGGTIYLTGLWPKFRDMDPQPIPIEEGTGQDISAYPNSPIECTIDPNGNTAVVEIFFN